MQLSKKRILFLNRSYYPDAEATGQLLTQLCEDLSEHFQVGVIAGQPNQNPRQRPFRPTGLELHNDVEIRRVRHTRFNKASLAGRAINYLSFLLSATVASLTAKRPDVVVVESDPPFLCLLGAFLRLRYRCKSVVYLQDIYPHLAIALGKLRDNWLTRILDRCFAATYRNCDRIVVLSEDMRNVVLDAGVRSDRVEIIPNWIDTEQVTPTKSNNPFRAELDVEDKFVVMYSGNLGLCQGLDNVLGAAEQLVTRDDIVFLLVGDGAAKKELMATAESRGLSNIQFVDYQPIERLGESLSAADLHLVPVDRRVSSFLMPSKLYGVLASETPVLTVAPAECELGRLVVREQVGVNVEPDQPEALAEKILWFVEWCDDLPSYGKRARQLAIDAFDRSQSVGRFQRMLQHVIEPAPRSAPPVTVPSEESAASLKGQPT